MKHVARGLLAMVLRPLRSLGFLALRFAAVKETVQGLEVLDPLVSGALPSRIPKVATALQLIGRHNPIVLRRIRRHLRAVVINNSRTGYLADRRLCVLNSSAVDKQTAEQLALDLVHEGMHAILDQAGFRYEGVTRCRIERACIRAEIRLADKLPGAEDLGRRAREKLELVWWTDSDLAAGREAELRDAGVPEWLLLLRRRISS